MVLETQRLYLRPWEEADAEALYEYARDERIGPVAGWATHTSVENSREIIRTVLSAPEIYAVCLRKENRPVGCVGLTVGRQSNLELPETEGEIGYWIGVPFWGRGFIPEATRAVIRRAFVELRLETLWCGYFDGNERSRRVQEKCGFRYHHTNRDILWKQLGDIRTEHITRITRAEWRDGLPTRRLAGQEIPEALALAWRIFSEYESPVYTREGTEEFRRCLRDDAYLAGIVYYGAFDEEKLIGVIGIRQEQRHICFFFVDGRYHRLGVGTRLFRRLLDDFPGQGITLNAAPFGLPFYRRLGFLETGSERTHNGIRFTPMLYQGES